MSNASSYDLNLRQMHNDIIIKKMILFLQFLGTRNNPNIQYAINNERLCRQIIY